MGIVFYKYLSDTFLTHVYDLLYNKAPENMTVAQKAYEEVFSTEDSEELLEDIKESYHYTISPELTYTKIAEAANNNSFQRETLQKAFNNIQQSDSIFANLFADVDLYSTRLGLGEQKQSSVIAELIKTINNADLLGHDGEILGDAYEYLIGQFASETGKKAGEFYTPQEVSQILTRIAIQGQEDKQGLLVYDPAMGSGSLLLNAKKYSNKLSEISIHGLRHTHASLLLFAGVSIASVARRLGHASMTTTQKTYLHIIQELENKDVDLVMRSLSGLS